MEALVYKGLLLRLQATLEKDPAKQQQLLKDAEKLSQQANDLRKKKARRHELAERLERIVGSEAARRSWRPFFLHGRHSRTR